MKFQQASPCNTPHSVPHLKDMLAKPARNVRQVDNQLHVLQLSASHTLPAPLCKASSSTRRLSYKKVASCHTIGAESSVPGRHKNTCLLRPHGPSRALFLRPLGSSLLPQADHYPIHIYIIVVIIYLDNLCEPHY
jgi:hypothetical protein